ncbi:MAG: AAA family ATPase [Selenomonadaceae bacterium]|nr:AAA family ATPase [Selenomonadaceae bacterium]MBQ3725440.1 AAA family ATPase [Selenomonadaceae bacterium]MBQ9496175.1 AAA family ATPase [Selenomonadaceae bacterium]
MLPLYVIGAALLGACLLNVLSDDEKKRQQRLEENYREYKNSSDEEYRRTFREHDKILNRMRGQTAHELWLERQRALAERKERNRKNFDFLMAEWQGQVNDKNNLLEQVKLTIETLKNSRTNEQATELRQSSLQTILSEAHEAMARQKAYMRYLERYKKSAEKIFERTGNLPEPFSMTLPEFFPYKGKIIGFEREDLLGGEFEKSIHQNVDCKFFCEDSEKIDSLFPDTEIIYCLVESYDDKSYTNKISCVKGMFLRKLAQSPNVQLATKVKRHEQNNGFLSAYILDVDGLEATLRKKNCRDRRNAPVGSRKFVYVMNFDQRELKWINATERIEDCLSVERFRNVPLLIKNCDIENFLDVVQKRNALENYDEWYMAPISDGENFSQTIYKCQLGQKLAFQASFTEDEFPKLCFEKFLPDEEMISADDIFVALDAELNAVTAERAETIPLDGLHESKNLLIYLSVEFLKQRRIKANQENVLFLNQWCAIMRRLIRAKESGGFRSVEILEQVDEKNFLTSADGAASLKKFYDWQCKQNPEANFFIRDASDKKIFVTFDSKFKIIRTAEILPDDFLERLGYSFDIHVQEFPYPEIMQSTALENFRCSFMQTPALKECILDLSRMSFKDSGRRPKTIKNSSLLRNKSQMLAVVRSVAVENFFMIQGPPGTGKTTVIKEIIWQQLRLNPASKILVVSQANVAVDNVLRGLPSIGIPRAIIVRCGNDDKISDDLKDFSLDKKVELYREKLSEPCRADLEPYRKIWRDMMKNSETQGLVGEYLLKKFSVTGATCVGLAKKHFGLDRLSFDLVIADEAGKALPGELLLPINRAKKIIIIGDHKQLPPVIDPVFFDETKVNIRDIVDEETRDKFFATSLFEKLYETCPADNKCMLNIQFRMPVKIGEMISDLFYERKLLCAPTCAEKNPLFFDNNILFLNMDDDPAYREKQDKLAGGKSGPYNEREISVAAALLKKLRENFSGRIALITPYKNQNKKLRRKLNEEQLKGVAVNTIDAFQGDEADVVIYCTTRAQVPTNYFSDAARLNVAFSRARNLLIIIGALKYFRKYKAGHLMLRVADYLESRGRVINTAELFSMDFQAEYHAPPSSKNFFEDFSETPLTPQEIERYLPARNDENSLNTCKGCGRKFNAEELIEGFCAECIFDGEHYKCRNCGADMLYTNAAKYIHHQPKEDLCADCKIIWRHTCRRCGKNDVIVRARDLKNNPLKREEDFPFCRECLTARKEKFPRRCTACGKEFFITQGQLEDLRAQGKSPSDYCKDCWTQDETAGYCKRCHRPIIFKRAKLHELRAQGKKIPDLCTKCFNERNEKIPVTCPACQNTFLQKRGYIEDLEAKGKTFFCDDCRKEKPLPRPCKICGNDIYISNAELYRLRQRFGADFSPPRTHKHCR